VIGMVISLEVRIRPSRKEKDGPHDREEKSQTGDEDHVVLTTPAREEQGR
jgi:hypothetical protein